MPRTCPTASPFQRAGGGRPVWDGVRQGALLLGGRGEEDLELADPGLEVAGLEATKDGQGGDRDEAADRGGEAKLRIDGSRDRNRGRAAADDAVDHGDHARAREVGLPGRVLDPHVAQYPD